MRLSPGLKRIVGIAAHRLGPTTAADGHGHETPVVVTRVEITYRGKRYALVPCPGSAHSNAFVDGCALCLGVAWGVTLEVIQ